MIDYCILFKRLRRRDRHQLQTAVQRWVDGGWRCVNMRCRSALPCLALPCLVYHVGLTYGARTVARQAAIDMGALRFMQQGGLLITQPIYNSQGERCGLIRRLPVFVVYFRGGGQNMSNTLTCTIQTWKRVTRRLGASRRRRRRVTYRTCHTGKQQPLRLSCRGRHY